MIPPKQEDTSKSAAATFLRASWAKMLAVNDKVLTRREGYINLVAPARSTRNVPLQHAVSQRKGFWYDQHIWMHLLED